MCYISFSGCLKKNLFYPQSLYSFSTQRYNQGLDRLLIKCLSVSLGKRFLKLPGHPTSPALRSEDEQGLRGDWRRDSVRRDWKTAERVRPEGPWGIPPCHCFSPAFIPKWTPSAAYQQYMAEPNSVVTHQHSNSKYIPAAFFFPDHLPRALGHITY